MTWRCCTELKKMRSYHHELEPRLCLAALGMSFISTAVCRDCNRGDSARDQMTDLLTLRQAARITRFSVWTLRHWITQGRLQAYRFRNNRWLTTIQNIILAADNNLTDKQRQANHVASQLMRELGLERVEFP